MSENGPAKQPLDEREYNRRELIKRIAVGSAFAVPVIASFDMASLGVSSAYANNANQSPEAPKFASADNATFTVGKELTFVVWIPASDTVSLTLDGKLPAGVKFTYLDDNYNDYADGTIAGKPERGTGGVYRLTLHADNGVPPAATQKFTLTVNEAPEFTSAAKATIHAGREASVKITTKGYPHAAISLSGKLPQGLTFKHDAAKGTATISGKAASSGVHKLKLKASNGVSPQATQEFTLTVS